MQSSACPKDMQNQIRCDLIESAARHAGYLKQRKADELQAGRRFENALDWINWTEMTKGEHSGNALQVRIRTKSGTVNAFYTQTSEYHKTGCGSISSEHNDPLTLALDLKHGNRDVYRHDTERARLFDHALTCTGTLGKSGPSNSQSQSRRFRLPFSTRENATAFSHRPVATRFQDFPQIRIPGGRQTKTPSLEQAPQLTAENVQPGYRAVHQTQNVGKARARSSRPSPHQPTELAQLEATANSVALTAVSEQTANYEPERPPDAYYISDLPVERLRARLPERYRNLLFSRAEVEQYGW